MPSDEERIFLHFTRWSLDGSHVGLTCSTPADSSYYWRSKLDRGWVPKVDLPSGIVINGVPLSELNGMLERAKYTAELLKEYVFEEVRATSFANRPSRRRCIFAFSTGLDAEAYREQLGLNAAHYRLIKIRVAPDARVHPADMALLNCNADDHAGLVQKAQLYWSGTDQYAASTEVLIEGSFEILDIAVSQPAARRG